MCPDPTAEVRYDLSLRYFFFLARMLIIFPIKNKPEEHHKTFLRRVVLYPLFWHQLALILLSTMSKKPSRVITEITAAISLKAVETICIFMLCLGFALSIHKNIRHKSSTVVHELPMEGRFKVILFIVGFTVFGTITNLAPNILNVTELCQTEGFRNAWKTVFDVAQFSICMIFEVVLWSYFLVKAYFIYKTLCKVNKDLSEEHLKKIDESCFETFLNWKKTEYSAACGVYKCLSQNYQTSGIVFSNWVAMIYALPFSEHHPVAPDDPTKLLPASGFLPFLVLPIVFFCYFIPDQARVASNRFKELRAQDNKDVYIFSAEDDDEMKDLEIPNFFKLTSLAPFYSSAILVFTFGGLLEEMFQNHTGAILAQNNNYTGPN